MAFCGKALKKLATILIDANFDISILCIYFIHFSDEIMIIQQLNNSTVIV